MAGSRRRYLAEQDAFMREKLGYEVRKAATPRFVKQKQVREVYEHGLKQDMVRQYLRGMHGQKISPSARANRYWKARGAELERGYYVSKIAVREMYHGTTRKGWRGIKREGLKGNLPQGHTNPDDFGVYATPKKEVADVYRRSDRRMVGARGRKGPRLKVQFVGPTKNWDFDRRGGHLADMMGHRIKPEQIVGYSKAEPLKTHMSERDAKRVVGRVGLAGELPKHYTREQRMGAYEARYVASGGRKGEKWQRRAERSDKIKTAGLAVATAGGAGILATRAKPVTRMMGAKGTKLRHAADTVALTGATVGGAGELDAARARRKRSSYASAPGGVAASALRRMRAMDDARSTR